MMASIRHPQSNIVERVNREISKFLPILLEESNHGAWFSHLHTVETIINKVHHDTTGLTPCELMTKKKPTRFWKEHFGINTLEEEESCHEQKLLLVRERIRTKGESRAALAVDRRALSWPRVEKNSN